MPDGNGAQLHEKEKLAELRRAWEDRPLGAMIDHILDRYHTPLHRDLPGLVDKIGSARKELTGPARELDRPLRDLEELLRTDLPDHLRAEEEALFPRIRAHLRADESRAERGEKAAAPAGGGLRSLGRIQDDHNQIMDMLIALHAENVLDRLPETTPAGDDHPLREDLKRLVGDLREHAFLEDEVLFPRAVALEKRLRNGTS